MPPRPVAPTALIGRRLFIVDDGEVNRRILRTQAQRWDMIPSEADSGDAALAWLSSNPRVDVAILDMQMPAWTASNWPPAFAAYPGAPTCRSSS